VLGLVFLVRSVRSFPIQIIAFLLPVTDVSLSWFDHATVAAIGSRKFSCLVSMAQIARAILLAKAIATNIRDLRALRFASHDPGGIALRPIQFRRDIAPIIKRRRMSA